MSADDDETFPLEDDTANDEEFVPEELTAEEFAPEEEFGPDDEDCAPEDDETPSTEDGPFEEELRVSEFPSLYGSSCDRLSSAT